jgi:hypothetical protein
MEQSELIQSHKAAEVLTSVMTSTLGRCVATMQWMPAARAICVIRAMLFSTSFWAMSIKSANSSMMTTM